MPLRNVLHIDDDEDDLDFFSSAVSELNAEINCISLTHAKEALEKLISGELDPHIIFLDLNMPGMTGFEFMEEIQKFKFKDIPIVVLSTCSLKETAIQVKKLGAKEYLTKPTSLTKLITLIKPFVIT